MSRSRGRNAICIAYQLGGFALLVWNIYFATTSGVLWKKGRDLSVPKPTVGWNPAAIEKGVFHIVPTARDPIDKFLEDFKESRRRVFIHYDHLFYETGGPEALIQVALAFNALLPGSTYFCTLRGLESNKPIGKRFLIEYPAIANFAVLSKEELRKGDVFIVPEKTPCYDDIIKRGVKEMVWLLRVQSQTPQFHDQMSRKRCGVFSHNFFLRDNLGARTHHMLRPYISPSLVRDAPNGFVPRSQRLVWINSEVSFDTVVEIQNLCRSTLLNCTAKKVKGFAREELPAAYSQGVVVFDNCLVGSERTVLESSIYGAIFVTTDCMCAKDDRDFPIPKRNILPQGNLTGLLEVLDRIFNNYEAEWKDYEEFRKLYRDDLNHESLVKEAKQFLYEIHGGTLAQN